MPRYIAQQVQNLKGKCAMKWLISAVLLMAIAVSSWWLAGSWTQECVVRSWLDARAAEGWLANYDSVDVTGFPSQFATRIAALELADPDTGWVWSAPDLILKQDAFRPDRLRAAWPQLQTIASPFERLEIASEGMISDLNIRPTAPFALDASDTVLSNVLVSSTAGWTMSLPEGRLSATRVDGEDSTYDIAFSVIDLTLPRPILSLLDPTGVLPDRVQRMASTARVAFDRPWDLRAVEERRPQITSIALDEMVASWGTLLFRTTGTLDVDDRGRPSGDLSVRAVNWREMIEMASNAGVFPQGLRGSAEALLGMVAAASGRPEDLDATLTFSDGRVFLGPIPLGSAPRLILR